MLSVSSISHRMQSITLIILLHFSNVCSDDHVLRYFYSGVLGPRLPELFAIGYVDDLQISFYSSSTNRTGHVAERIMKNVTSKFWESITKFNKLNEAAFQKRVMQVKSDFNQSEDHKADCVLQEIYGCELRNDKSTSLYFSSAYNMKEFITFDTQNNRFIPLMPEAYNFTQKMNNPEDPWQREMMYHMKKDCNIILEGIMTYVKEELEKKVRPGVKVMGRESGEITKLHCLVYGFYPRAVDVKWMKKRTDEVPTYQTTHVLPNPDGTYQIRVSAEVIPQEGDRYSCYVDHSSLEEPLLVDWEPRNSTRTHVLIVVLVGLLIVSIIAGVVIYKKRKTISTWTSNHTVRCLELLR